jgi:hypothetical protein
MSAPATSKNKSALTSAVSQFVTAFPRGTYLGTQPLFSGVRVVEAASTDWIILPSGDDPLVKLNSLHAPRRAKRVLTKLADSKAPVAALYIAHEVPTGAAARLKTRRVEDELRTDPAEKNRLLAERLESVGHAVTGLLAPPFLALGALANAGLDPAVFAAITASGTAQLGELAAFFLIVSWV